MKSKIMKRIGAVILCLIMAFSSVPVMADEQKVTNANYYLYPYDAAVEALEGLIKEQEIYALIYLTDAYSIHSEANPNSAVVATLASGQMVKVVGVSRDSGSNIWYKVSYSYNGSELNGYVARGSLAFSDERLMNWEDTYVRSRYSNYNREQDKASQDIEQFPESYKSALYSLKDKYPNWTFVRMDTGLDWNNAVAAESTNGRNVIWASSAKESWKNGMSSDKNWAICSTGIVKYYLDPRNFLTESQIFQFEQLTYNASYQSMSATQQILKNTFMADANVPGFSNTYAQAFLDIAARQNVSPYLLASRVKQEQGAGNSPLISGTYSGYENLYNYYNIGAYGSSTKEIIEKGLAKAREQGWTNRMLSLEGGAVFLAQNYIHQGQDTLYLQKFDVDSQYKGVYDHQYMTNIQAPYSEASSTYSAYNKSGIIDNGAFVFRIPVYNNMPSYACTKPGSEDTISLSSSAVENLPVGQISVLASFINGTQNTSVDMSYTSSDSSIAKVSSTGVVTGISPGTVTITCKKKENAESANTVSCQVTVIKADISLNTDDYPQLAEITYNPQKTLKDIVLPSGYTWVDETLIPMVENEGYSVIYNPDNSRYNSMTLTLPLTVNKADIAKESLSFASGLTGIAGDELRSISLPQGYAWEEPETVLPKKVGSYSYTASYCQDESNYNVTTGISMTVTVECSQHEFGDWTGTHADCTHDGTLIRSCSICGEKETVTEAALGHEYSSMITKEATDTEDGIRTFTCSRCKDTYTEVIPATGKKHNHSYTSVVTKPATCLETGVKTFTCSCGDTYTETIEALGHDIVNGACTRCDYKIPVEPVHVHNYTISGTTATCTDSGVTTYTCSCGDSYTENTNVLGHDYINGVCSRCGAKEVSTTPTPTTTPSAMPTITTKPIATATTTPMPTTKPTATATVTPTEQPKVTPTPTKTVVAEITTLPKPTVVPEITTLPKVTVVPEITTLPKATAVPEITTLPKATAVPEVTKLPETAQVTPSSESNGNKTVNVPTQEVKTESLNVVRINMQDSTVLDSSKIGKLSEEDETLELLMPNNVVWNIDVNSIEDMDSLNIDMAVEIGTADIPDEVLKTVDTEEPFIVMTLAYDGPFNFNAQLSIPVEEEYYGKVANLYYYNPTTKELEFVSAVNVSEDGYADFNMKHASDYMIVFADASLEELSTQESIAEDTSEETTEALSTKIEEDSIWNIVLIVSIIVLLLVCFGVATILIKVRHKKEEFDESEEENESEEGYYLDEEDK